MTNIFYLLGLWLVVYETSWILNPYENAIKRIKFLEMCKTEKGKKWDAHTEEFKDAIKGKVFSQLIPIFWIIIGLISAQWFLFLVLFLFSLSINKIASWFKSQLFMYAMINWLSSIVIFIIATLIIINHYHLHYNFFQLTRSYFNI